MGRVINIMEPTLAFCPLAKHLYKDFDGINGNNKDALTQAIKNAIELKISHYGFFTERRELVSHDMSIPYGASEMLSSALKRGAIDAAVIVCEGAGTVIANAGEVVQGIGARMNTLLQTSPIQGIMSKLKALDCRIVSEDAMIDQVRGVAAAIRMGYKTIAVTIRGDVADDLVKLESIEREHGASVISLVVCTTGIRETAIEMIRKHADLVWACASKEVRAEIGHVAIRQLSKQIPVFVLTQKGVDFAAAYSQSPVILKNVDRRKQYVVSNEKNGQRVRFGDFEAFINEGRLPVPARNSPRFGKSEE